MTVRRSSNILVVSGGGLERDAKATTKSLVTLQQYDILLQAQPQPIG